MSKASRKAELEEQYKKHLEEIEASEEEGDEDDEDIIILRGNARKEFLKSLQKAGFSLDEAKEEADDVEEEVDPNADPEADPEAGDESEVEEAKGKTPKKVTPEKDPKPPSRSRYFGGK